MEYTQTELDFLFNYPIDAMVEEPELQLNIEFSSAIEELKPEKVDKDEMNESKEQVKKKRFPKRFFYEDYYEIYYSNRKNIIMIKNYKVCKYHNIKLSSFILRCHGGLTQDDTLEIRTCKMIVEYFEFQLKKGNFLCDFFVNEDDGRLWLVIKTDWTEYLYDITTHFLVLCCNEGEYEWYSLLNCEYIDYSIDTVIASNKAQYSLLISWLHGCLKHMYLTSRDTTN
jgi:hypothetical protein